MDDTIPDPAADLTSGDRTQAPRPPAIPVLHLHGFDGPMDLLFDLAERQRIDFGRMSILVLTEQFVAALEQLKGRTTIERRADWVVMATRLVLLRSRLLFPESTEAAAAAQLDAAAELRRITRIDSNAGRCRLARGTASPGAGRVSSWARRTGGCRRRGCTRGRCHRVPMGEPGSVRRWYRHRRYCPRYRPVRLDLHPVPDARARIPRRLAESPTGQWFELLLPEGADAVRAEPQPSLRRRSAWTSTFVASLELAKQADVAVRQESGFAPIHLHPTSSRISR